MQKNTALAIDTAFGKDVYEGLTSYPKKLSSKYFYDAVGDKLFQKIMAMPEYYLTNCEYTILDTYKEEITKLFIDKTASFNLFELGAGDGKKTKILLRHFMEQGIDFVYQPIDISKNALDQLAISLNEELPNLPIAPLQGTYFETLNAIKGTNGVKKVILFLGSNIGNLLHKQAIEFLQALNNVMNDEDVVLMGFDQKKHPQEILDAYNDKNGITEAFNKNILTRINKELEGNFNEEQFIHWEVYDPETGTAKSYLVSKVSQTVRIKNLDLSVTFKQWETIHTEISQKYDDKTIAWLVDQAGLEIAAEFSDNEKKYKNYILKKK